MRSPTIDLAEIGAGGGSLAWFDRGGALRVGPQSAGADPGPACYGRGGTQPTVTDANVVLGLLNPHHLLDGDMPIDIAAARTAIKTHIADPLGLSVEEAARGIHAVANAAMTRAIQAVSSEIGRAPGDFTMIAFGGNGAVHGASLAAHAGMRDIIIPPASGVFSALGLLFARIQHRLVRVCWQDIAHADCDLLNAAAAELLSEADQLMRAEGLASAHVEIHLVLDLRYAGQSSEIGVPLPQGRITAERLAEASGQFHREHERSFGYANPGERVQIVNLRLRARSQHRKSSLPVPSALRTVQSAIASGERPVYFAQGWIATPVIRREILSQTPRRGPLIVEEYDTTIVVPPGASVHAVGGIVRIRLEDRA